MNDNENKSPVYHEENCLGLASWCVRPLYCYTYNRLIELRAKKRREDSSTTSRWLLGAILLNPDISTFWNMRRELIRNRRLDPLQELKFTQIVLYNKAKCFEAFAYRRWIIEYILMENEFTKSNVESLLRTEIRVAAMSADRYANNYHAWSHREYVITTYQTVAPTTFGSVLLSEWESSKNWCSQHVSDHSGLSYRQFLLKQLLLLERWPEELKIFFTPQQVAQRRAMISLYIKSGTKESNISLLYNDSCDCDILNYLHGKDKNQNSDVNYKQILMALSYWIEDCSVNQDLINCFTGHESLWYHRRFLAYSLRCIENSYSKYFCYKCETFNPQHCVRLDQEEPKSPLEIAFMNHNDKIIALEEKQLGQQSHIVKKFVEFLAILYVQP